MNNQFDELAKGLAQSVTRRAAFKRFGVGLAGMALACFGLANKAEAHNQPCLQPGAGCLRGSIRWRRPACVKAVAPADKTGR